MPASVVGALFTRDSLAEAIKEVPERAEIDVARIRADLARICVRLAAEHSPNETQTEDAIISNNPPHAPAEGVAAEVGIVGSIRWFAGAPNDRRAL